MKKLTINDRLLESITIATNNFSDTSLDRNNFTRDFKKIS